MRKIESEITRVRCSHEKLPGAVTSSKPNLAPDELAKKYIEAKAYILIGSQHFIVIHIIDWFECIVDTPWLWLGRADQPVSKWTRLLCIYIQLIRSYKICLCKEFDIGVRWSYWVALIIYQPWINACHFFVFAYKEFVWNWVVLPDNRCTRMGMSLSVCMFVF